MTFTRLGPYVPQDYQWAITHLRWEQQNHPVWFAQYLANHPNVAQQIAARPWYAEFYAAHQGYASAGIIPKPATAATATTAPGTTTPAPAPGTPAAPTADQQSAKSTIQAMLDQWGLGSLGDWAWNKYLNGEPIDALSYDIRQTDTYKQRFPGMAALQAKGQAISEADYIAKESADTQLMKAYGLDDSMISRDQLGQLIGGQVSTAELQNRLEDRAQLVDRLPQQVKDYAQRVLGLNTGDLIGLWENPAVAEPILRQKVSAAAVGGAANLAGFNTLDPQVAARLAGVRADSQGNVDFSAIAQDFQKAGMLRALTQQLPGQNAPGASEQDLINAEVGGDSTALQNIQNEALRRRAQFGDQEAVATTSKGVEGLAPTNV